MFDAKKEIDANLLYNTYGIEVMDFPEGRGDEYHDYKLYGGEIELCVYTQGGGDLHRLSRVIGYIAAIEDIENHRFLHKVKKLHDHKGELTVYWKEEPTDAEKDFMVKAWESKIGDGGGPVKHELIQVISSPL